MKDEKKTKTGRVSSFKKGNYISIPLINRISVVREDQQEDHQVQTQRQELPLHLQDCRQGKGSETIAIHPKQ